MKKGFTIVELLAVITLLALIFALVVPNIDKIIKRNTNNLYDIKIEELKTVAEQYTSNHQEQYDYSTNSSFYLTIEQLVDEGLLEEDQAIDPRNNKELNGRIKVTYCAVLTGECDVLNTFKYEYEEN